MFVLNENHTHESNFKALDKFGITEVVNSMLITHRDRALFLVLGQY